MKHKHFLAILVALCINPSQAVTYFYKGTGDISSIISWTTDRNGSGTTPANFTTAGNTFVIQNGQAPTLGSAWTINGSGSNLFIETGGSLNTGANNPSLTLNMESGASYVMSNSTYNNLTFDTIHADSTFDYQATVSGAFRDSLTYGNLLWNYNTGNVTPGNVTTTGSLTNNTGGSREVRVATGSTARTWNIGTNLNNNAASILNLNNGTAASTINVGGDLTNIGTINKTAAGASSLNFSGSTASSATWGTVTTANFSNVTITVESPKVLTFQDSLNAGAATFQVNGTLDIGTNVLSGSGTFTLAEGAKLITSHTTGLDGAIAVTTKNFNPAAHYEFRGAGTGTALPSTVHHLTINRASGDVTLDGSGSTQIINGTLSLLSGNLSAGTTRNTITAGALVMRDAQINSSLNITLSGNVSFDAANSGTATIAGNLDLGGATRTFNVANGLAANDMYISGNISSGGVTKLGLGTLAFSGDKSYNGTTAIEQGTLIIDGNHSGSGSVIVGEFGMLGGDGTIEGNLVFETGAHFLFNPDASLTANGNNVSFGGFSMNHLLGISSSTANGIYTLINGDATFDFANVSHFGFANAYDLGNGKSAYFQQGSFQVVVIPEPNVALLLSGIGLTTLLRRRR